MWLEGFLGALHGTNPLWLLLGVLWGMFIGVLPAIGCNFAVALMLPLTFGMHPATAMIFLCAAHVATNYGDSLASILVNIPGGPGTVATCWDGHPMAKRGTPGRALGIATLASFIGGFVTWISLAFLTKPLTTFAFVMGAPEYFALGVMALSLVSVAARGETLKGLIMVCIGLLLSTVGQDPVTGDTFRFAFHVPWLEAGIDIVISTLGIFAISEIFRLLEERSITSTMVEVRDSIFSGFLDVIRRPLTVLRSALVGWFVGILPALGVSLAGISSYLVEKNYSKERADFGKGSPAGVIAAETGKGACVIGDLIPTFLLGVPGSVTGAILMAALIMHGINPGPMFLTSGALPYMVFAGLALGQLACLIVGPPACKLLARVIFVPSAILAPAVTVLAFLGAYTENNSVSDIWMMVVFGVIGYALDRIGYPLICMVLGLILGPLVEANLHRALGITFGSPIVFAQRPIAIGMLLITLLFLVGPYLPRPKFLLHRVSLPAGEKPEAPRSATSTQVLALALMCLTTAGSVFLSRGYPPEARLFPSFVGILGTVMIVYRCADLARVIVVKKRAAGTPSSRPAEGQPPVVPWQTTVSLLLGYAVLISVIGFVAATAVFALATAFAAGYRKPFGLAGLSLGLAVFTLVFAKVLGILLPTGVIYSVIPWL